MQVKETEGKGIVLMSSSKIFGIIAILISIAILIVGIISIFFGNLLIFLLLLGCGLITLFLGAVLYTYQRACEMGNFPDHSHV